MCIMADFVEKTLRDLSIDKEGSRSGDMVYVTESMVKAIDFDAFAKNSVKAGMCKKCGRVMLYCLVNDSSILLNLKTGLFMINADLNVLLNWMKDN